MILQLESRDFWLEHAQVCLIPPDWEQAALDTGQIPRSLLLERGRVYSAPVARAGDFELVLADVSAVRRSDNQV